MTFKRRDAERYIVKEYGAIKRLVQVICSDAEESHGGLELSQKMPALNIPQ